MAGEVQRDPFRSLAGSYEDWFESPPGSYVLGQQLKALVRSRPRLIHSESAGVIHPRVGNVIHAASAI